MADKKISELTAATALTVGGVDILPIVQGGETKKISVATLTSVVDVSGTLDVAGATTLAGVTATSLSVPTGTVTNLSADTVTVTTSLSVPTATLTGDLGVANIVASGDVGAASATITGDVGAASATITGSASVGVDLDVMGIISGGSLSVNTGVVAVDVTATNNISSLSLDVSGTATAGSLLVTNDIDSATLTTTGNISGNNVSATLEVSATTVSATTIAAIETITGNVISGLNQVTGTNIVGTNVSAENFKFANNEVIDTDGAINLNKTVSYFTNTTITPYVATLGAGTEGKIKHLLFAAIDITITTADGFNSWASIVPTAPGAYVSLIFTQGTWFIFNKSDVTVT